jgi:ferric-dicitrate binding protein FerR (iron transport regulator)
MNRRRFLIVGGAMALPLQALAADPPLVPAGAVPAGSVAAGTASAMLETMAARPLNSGSPVYVLDTVHTGAKERVGLKLGAATMLSLGPSARLRIDKFLVDAGGELNLGEGALLFDRSPAEPGRQTNKEMILRSSYGLIAVRGTRFFAGPSGGGFGVYVARGAVDVVGGGKTVRVDAGQGTDIARLGDEPSNPRGWPQARVREAMLLTTGSPQ